MVGDYRCPHATTGPCCCVEPKERGPMPRAVHVATIGFAGMIVFEAVLAAGARLGDAAWGGAHTQLTTGQRFGSAASVLFYAAAIVIVRRRAAGRAERRY